MPSCGVGRYVGSPLCKLQRLSLKIHIRIPDVLGSAVLEITAFSLVLLIPMLILATSDYSFLDYDFFSLSVP